MAEVTEQDKATAQALIGCDCGTKTHKHMTDCPRHGIAWEDVAEALAAAREQATPPKGHVMTDDGTVRKVCGKLPVTADGCVVMPGTEVFHPDQDPSFHLEVMRLLPDTTPSDDFPLPEDCEYMAHYSYWESETGYSAYESYDVRACYSTRAAAESARATP